MSIGLTDRFRTEQWANTRGEHAIAYHLLVRVHTTVLNFATTKGATKKDGRYTQTKPYKQNRQSKEIGTEDKQ